MIQIKISDKIFAPLTAFNVGEYGGLTYKKTLGAIGDCSFTLDINNDKVTEINLRNYNHLEVWKDGVKEWSGYIITKKITFNQVEVQCKEIIGILGKRLVPDNYTLSGNAGTAIGTLLAYINGIEDTGITMGATDVTDSINMTFNQQDALSILQSIADTVQAQFVINEDRTLDFKYEIGNDLTADVEFDYNILQPANANLNNFEVEDNGENLVSRSYGKTSTLTSVQDDAGLRAKFPLLEQFNSFTQANTQGMLDALVVSKLTDTLYSPTLNLTPTVEDNFNIGDLVAVKISNKLISIDDSFQILEKNVKIVNSQKQISVKINKLPQDIAKTIRDLQKKVNLLETK